MAEKFNQLDKAADEALAQIEDRGYVKELEDDGYATVYRYGIAFCGKDCMVKLADVENWLDIVLIFINKKQKSRRLLRRLSCFL